MSLGGGRGEGQEERGSERRKVCGRPIRYEVVKIREQKKNSVSPLNSIAKVAHAGGGSCHDSSAQRD